jgi:hypothetical protein
MEVVLCGGGGGGGDGGGDGLQPSEKESIRRLQFWTTVVPNT